MKALSIRQPWAWLIVNGHKDVENRAWHSRHKGPLLIHASKTMDKEALNDLLRGKLPFIANRQKIELWQGGIVGIVDLWMIRHVGENIPGGISPWHEPECWGWYLKNARSFETPIEYRGWPGLFDVPDSVVQEALSATDGR